jgi:hypothetical protein
MAFDPKAIRPGRVRPVCAAVRLSPARPIACAADRLLLGGLVGSSDPLLPALRCAGGPCIRSKGDAADRTVRPIALCARSPVAWRGYEITPIPVNPGNRIVQSATLATVGQTTGLRMIRNSLESYLREGTELSHPH